MGHVVSIMFQHNRTLTPTVFLSLTAYMPHLIGKMNNGDQPLLS